MIEKLLFLLQEALVLLFVRDYVHSRCIYLVVAVHDLRECARLKQVGCYVRFDLHLEQVIVCKHICRVEFDAVFPCKVTQLVDNHICYLEVLVVGLECLVFVSQSLLVVSEVFEYKLVDHASGNEDAMVR